MGSDVEVTEADREKAGKLWARCRDGSALALVHEIAEALADERAKARAPFLEIAVELESESMDGGRPWDELAALDDTADRIRSAAQDPPEVSET